jgi:ribosome-binding ATPase
MFVSIIGTAQSGKTTLFKALAGANGNGNNGGGSGFHSVRIEVPDERVDALTKIFNPRKTTYSRLDVTDTVAIREGEIKNETLDAKSLQQIRQSDAILLVLRHFDSGHPADPVGDFLRVQEEFVLADMIQTEGRLERLRKQNALKPQPALQQEQSLLELCLGHLEAGSPLATLALSCEDDKKIRGFLFLSRKPMMIVINCVEERLAEAESITSQLRERLPGHIPIVAACGQLEAELAVMPLAEQAEFMAEYGIGESLRGRIIRLAYDTLGLISFLTVGEDECRAWPVRRGMSAQDAAGTIHTDLARTFIRAETVSYEDFIRLEGFVGCKKAGVWRLEGKGYLVQDGDILSIRAGN